MSSIPSGSVIAVVRAKVVPEPAAVVAALVDGGITHVEFTFTIPRVLEVLEQAAANAAIAVGVGTVTTACRARRAIDAGAQFLVTPGVAAEVAEATRETSVSLLLGAMTPTEVLTALSLEVDAVKVFPAGALGPGYLRDLRGPFPHAALVPSGGVTPYNAAEFRAAGAHAISSGYPCPSDLIETGNYASLAARASELVTAAQV